MAVGSKLSPRRTVATAAVRSYGASPILYHGLLPSRVDARKPGDPPAPVGRTTENTLVIRPSEPGPVRARNEHTADSRTAGTAP